MQEKNIITPSHPLYNHHCYWMKMACDLAYSCPESKTAFAVGAVIVGNDNRLIASAYSRMPTAKNDNSHAEENAIAIAEKKGEDLTKSVLYSSLQPCARRQSSPQSCQQLIVKAHISEIYYAAHETPHFLIHPGDGYLHEHGVKSYFLDGFQKLVERANPHVNFAKTDHDNI